MNAMLEIKSKLQEYLPVLKQKYPISDLALFGSVTRNDFNPGTSDVDIMVEFNDDVSWEFFDIQQDLAKILGQKVDLVSKRAIKPNYWEFIKDDVVHV